MADLPRRVALVYDRVNKWGGAERVLLALHEIFPDAPLFTAVYNAQLAQWARVFPQIVPSFLQKLTTRHEFLPWATPVAFESFTFDEYDAVISVTSADAKGVITKPDTFHLCYCLTPTRYLWSHYELYKSQTVAPSFLFEYLKRWDSAASSRPDSYVAISNTVKNRIHRYYGRESEVVYPPVDVDFFSTTAPTPTLKNYFLYVGRLVAYKQAKLIVETFNDLALPLALIGSGSTEQSLRQIARPNIVFLGQRTDEELASYYQNAQALIFFHEEDFGIVPVEAMAAGTPIIGLNRGGVSETVVHNKTGILTEDLRSAVLNFNRDDFDAKVIQAHAQNFAKTRFQEEFKAVFSREWTKYKTTYMS